MKLIKNTGIKIIPAKLLETSSTPLALQQPNKTPTTRFWLPILAIRLKWSTTLKSTRGWTTTLEVTTSWTGILLNFFKTKKQKWKKWNKPHRWRDWIKIYNRDKFWQIFRLDNARMNLQKLFLFIGLFYNKIIAHFTFISRLWKIS